MLRRSIDCVVQGGPLLLVSDALLFVYLHLDTLSYPLVGRYHEGGYVLVLSVFNLVCLRQSRSANEFSAALFSSFLGCFKLVLRSLAPAFTQFPQQHLKTVQILRVLHCLENLLAHVLQVARISQVRLAFLDCDQRLHQPIPLERALPADQRQQRAADLPDRVSLCALFSIECLCREERNCLVVSPQRVRILEALIVKE